MESLKFHYKENWTWHIISVILPLQSTLVQSNLFSSSDIKNVGIKNWLLIPSYPLSRTEITGVIYANSSRLYEICGPIWYHCGCRVVNKCQTRKILFISNYPHTLFVLLSYNVTTLCWPPLQGGSLNEALIISWITHL